MNESFWFSRYISFIFEMDIKTYLGKQPTREQLLNNLWKRVSVLFFDPYSLFIRNELDTMKLKKIKITSGQLNIWLAEFKIIDSKVLYKRFLQVSHILQGSFCKNRFRNNFWTNNIIFYLSPAYWGPTEGWIKDRVRVFTIQIHPLRIKGGFLGCLLQKLFGIT